MNEFIFCSKRFIWLVLEYAAAAVQRSWDISIEMTQTFRNRGLLLDHKVPVKNFMLVCLLMDNIDMHSIAYTYPNVLFVTPTLDPDEQFNEIPAIENIGDRYFGTAETFWTND